MSVCGFISGSLDFLSLFLFINALLVIRWYCEKMFSPLQMSSVSHRSLKF